LVRFLGVSKSFGRAEVLRGIDLDVHSGECLGLAGLNGAGKTTLIKCLLDFCDLDSGAIEIHRTAHRRPRDWIGHRVRLRWPTDRFHRRVKSICQRPCASFVRNFSQAYSSLS